jgi:hypothetical protein
MVNIKSLSSTDPKLGQLRDSELFRISDHNNLYPLEKLLMLYNISGFLIA